MSYVIYNLNTTKLLRMPAASVGCYKEYYKSEAAAKAALTRAVKKGKVTEKEANEIYRISDAATFSTKIEKTEMVRNLMSGEMIEQSVNTPRCCDPSSELYWSM